jgi:hypothetical protein
MLQGQINMPAVVDFPNSGLTRQPLANWGEGCCEQEGKGKNKGESVEEVRANGKERAGRQKGEGEQGGEG